MIVRTRHKISRSYILTALTYWIFCDRESRSIDDLTPKKAIEIVRDRVYWSGQSNWMGAGSQIHEELADATEDYNELQKEVEIWIDKNIPNKLT